MKYSELHIDRCGKKIWIFNGELHNENGPSIEYKDGTKYWYINGKIHREDGPAAEYSNGTCSWYYEGKYIPVCSQKEFNTYIKCKAFW